MALKGAFLVAISYMVQCDRSKEHLVYTQPQKQQSQETLALR